jgi:tetratricopeptide (TPR) repeat protein
MSGAEYQARVAAYVYVAMLSGAPIAWFGVSGVGRTPIAVSGETRGAGDDLRVEFAESLAASEIQAKLTAGAGQAFRAFVSDVRQRVGDRAPVPVALVVSRRSTNRLWGAIRGDLDRLRGGREDDLAQEITDLLLDEGYRTILEHLWVWPADFHESDPERETALDRLRTSVLVDASQAEIAWSELVADALTLSATGHRRDVAYLKRLLERRAIGLKPQEREARWSQRIELLRQQLDLRHDQIVLAALLQDQQSSEFDDLPPRTRAAMFRLQAIAQLRLGKGEEAWAAAQRAVDVDPLWTDALATAAQVAADAGRQAEGRDFARRALQRDPASSRAWVAAVQTEADTAEFGEPPAAVRRDPDYNLRLALKALDRGDYQGAIDILTPLIDRGDATVYARFHFAHALALSAGAPQSDEGVERLQRALQELSGLGGSLQRDDPFLLHVLLLRSQVNTAIGKAEDAANDVADAHRLGGGDPALVEHVVMLRQRAGDYEGALRAASVPATDESPRLLAMRAGLLAVLRREKDARADIESARALLETDGHSDELFMDMAETALLLGDLSLASGLADQVSEAVRNTAPWKVLEGELAFAEGDRERGRAAFRAAVELDGGQAHRWLVGLAVQLVQTREFDEAVATFDEVGLEQVPTRALHPYAVAANAAGDLQRVQAALDALPTDQPTPMWALQMSADLAIRREDLQGAVSHLTELDRRAEPSARVRLSLAQCLMELDRPEEAAEQTLLTIEAAPSPLERVQAALFLKELGHEHEAVRQGFIAFRADRNNPDIQRAFAGLVFMSGHEFAQPQVVEVGTHVRLRNADDARREYTILDGPPLERISGELDEAAAQTLGLLGKRAGDQVADPDLQELGGAWTVEEVLPAEVYAAQRIMNTYSANFPDEPFFVRAYSIGDGEQVRDWAPLIRELEGRKRSIQGLLEIHHAQVLPVAFTARAIGMPVAEFMNAARADAAVRPILVEWASAEDLAGSVESAGSAREVVLTRTALHTAHGLGLLDIISNRYQLVVPPSLLVELRNERKEARRITETGRDTLYAGPDRPGYSEIPAHHPTLMAAADSVETIAEWVVGNARREARPLGAIGDPGSEREQARARLGPAAYDALALAEAGIGTLYADDLGLRRFRLDSARRAASFSTVSLLCALANEGLIDQSRRYEWLIKLLVGGYAHVRPELKLLTDALDRQDLSSDDLAKVFASLGGPRVSIADAMEIGANAIKHVITSRAVGTPGDLEHVTEIVLRSLTQVPIRDAAKQLVRRCARSLALLPDHLARVKAVCERVAFEAPRRP